MKKIILLAALCIIAMQGYTQQLDLGTYVDHSDTTSAASKTVMSAANGNGRIGWIIQNQSGDGTVMYVNFTDAATSGGESIKLIDGAVLSTDNYSTTEAIKIYCASSGKKYMAKEFIGK